MKIEAVDIQTVEGEQSIRIPEALRIDDNRVYLKKAGNAIVVLPFHNPWQPLFESLGQFSVDFMEDRQQPSQESRESLD